jgi:hypothetical protein
MNTPTPETDRAWLNYLDDDFSEGIDPWELATRLEQERDKARGLLGQAIAAITHLETELIDARMQAEAERDKTCHPDHGGHLFAWETKPGTGSRPECIKPYGERFEFFVIGWTGERFAYCGDAQDSNLIGIGWEAVATSGIMCWYSTDDPAVVRTSIAGGMRCTDLVGMMVNQPKPVTPLDTPNHTT